MTPKEQMELLDLLDRYEKASRIEERRNKLVPFMRAMAPQYMIGPHHKKIASILESAARGEKRRVIINIGPRHGKLLADDTPVLTVGGWKTHGDLVVGDRVFSPSGDTVRVVWVSERDVADVRVEFFDGSVIYCHENHEWTLFNVSTRRYETVEAGVFLRGRRDRWGEISGKQEKVLCNGNAMYFLPPVSPLVFDGVTPIHRFHEKRRIGLKSVTRVAEPKYGKCIQVDADDGLYLVGKNLVPTHNSEQASYLFPGWFLGNFPDKKVIMTSHTAELAVNFGRRVRNMIETPEYQEIFPGVTLSTDSKAAGRWDTGAGGQYFAIGVGGALAGRGGDLILVDDPISEQDAKAGNIQVYLDQWEWFQQGLMTRLMPGGVVVVLMTRWHQLDLTGQIINHMTKNPDADQWEVIEFPAVLNEGEENEKPLWPDFWSLEELRKKKLAVGPVAWAAQYMQKPTSEGAQIIKREWWKDWVEEDPPECEYLIMTVDTAQEAKQRADYTACQVWGVFYLDGPDGLPQANIIALNAWRRRIEYPELKQAILNGNAEWKPDTILIEKKSNGAALYQELRRMGVPVSEFTPGRGQDKVARVNSVSDIISSGLVWVPMSKHWAQELVMECAEFPLGANDDQVDAMTLALRRFRTGGFIKLPTDAEDEEYLWKRRGKRYY